MTQEEKEFINVEDGYYDNDLRQMLYFKKNVLGYETSLISSVLKLVRWDFILKPVDFFDEDEKQLLSKLPDLNLVINKELLSRWLDYAMLYYEKLESFQIKMATSAYLDVFKSTEKREYFLRALELARPVKKMFKDRFDEF